MNPNSLRRFRSAIVLAALIFAGCATSHAQTPPASPSPVNFLAASVYQNNGHPNQSGIAGLAFDDFNGDGNTDIVAVDGSNCVSFFPGDGKGSFGSPVDTCNLPSRNIYWAASGDFNNDGVKDLAVVATNPGTITMMLLQGNGNGTFTYQNSITINHSQEQATDLKAADLNGDHKPDLVLTSTGSGSPGFYSTYVFLWNGNFSFSQSAITGLGGCPHAAALVIADFNHDMRPDLAVSNGACGLHEIDVMIGNGDGTFQPPVGYSTDVGAPNSIAAGDFNGDGNIDLVSVNNLGGTPLNTFLGNGDGTFRNPIDTPSVYDPDYVAVGDFNGDGKDDVIVSSDQLDGVQISNGDGTFAPPNGTFAPPVQYAVLSVPTRIYVEDLNGDKRPDWVSITHGSEQFCVALGTGTGGFPAAIDSWSTPDDAGSTDAIVAADFNQDFNLDYATVGPDSNYPGINISMGDGAGHFDVPVHYTAGNNPNALVAGKFNKDKYPDIAVLDQSDGMVTVLLNNGDGTLGTPKSYSVGAGGGLIETGDFNGDGILDLIATNSGDGTVSVLLGNGDGTFQPQVVSPSQSAANYLAVGDFDGDGILDVAVTSFSNPDIEVLLGNGNGSFQTPIPVLASALPNACGLAAGDLNHDGRADLVRCSQLLDNGTGGHGGVGVFLNNGTGPGIVSFQAPVAYPVDPVGMNGFSVGGSGDGIPRIGDLNNDGNMDIVIAAETAYPEFDGANIGPAILLGRGDGTFILNPAHPAIAGQNERDIALGDFNNDGLLDMVVQNGAGDIQSSTVTMLLGTSGTEVALTSSQNPSTLGDSVTFNASVVTSFLGLPIPTGTITFQVGSTSVPVELVNGAASYSTASLPVGTTAVTAAYSGDQNFIPETSFALSEHVTTGPLTIGTSSLPDAIQNTPYDTSVSASGGVPSYTFSLANGSVLPAGLTINAAGVISGSPTPPGTTTFTVQVADSSSPAQTATAILSITVASNLQITPVSLQNGVVGNSYSESLAATGGIPSYTFSLANGSVLPAGLTMSTTGAITGKPTAPGTTTFTVQLQDSANPAQTTSAVLSITVTPGLSITTTSLVNGAQGTAYSASVSATGGVLSYTFSLANGSVLPANLTINSAGLISGTPTAPGTTTFTVQATDSSSPAQTATQVLSITVAGNLQITTTSLLNGVVGNSYTATVMATGGNLPETSSLANGTVLPAGLTISATGAITGKPIATGTTNFTVQVKDSSATPQTVTQNLSITVTPALSITTTPLVNGIQGSPYSASVSAMGGVPSYTFSLANGTVLPAGLTINAAGLISGTPTAPGTTTFTVQASDSSSPAQAATAVLSITVSSDLTITTASLPNGAEASPYSTSVSAAGGVLPYTFSLASGSVLPAGLTISATGVISGTPTAPGTTTFTVQVKDSSPTPQAVTASLSITIGSTLQITATTLPQGEVGDAYTAKLTGLGGNTPYMFSLASGSALPAGLTISAGGVISGKPTAAGTSTFTVQLRDSTSTPVTVTAPLSITVNGPLAFTTTSLPGINEAIGGGVGLYSQVIYAQGGVGPFTFSLLSGALPPGVTLPGAFGVAAGTEGVSIGGFTSSSDSGTYTFTVQVSDSLGDTATQQLSITVTQPPPPLQITTTSLPNGVVGTPYNAAVAATGGTGPYTFSLGAFGLPAGLLMSSAGRITGTPTATNFFAFFDVQVKDATGATATGFVNLTIAATAVPLQITTTGLPNGVVGTPYSTSIAATGGTLPYTVSIIGTLPRGLTMSSTGIITGSPLAAGTSNFTVRVRDSSTTPQTATANLSIFVSSVPVTPLQITTTILPSGNLATAYTASVQATGGTVPYTFSATGLPAGLTMSGAGTISGTPTTAGTFTVQVRAHDNGTPAQTTTALLALTVTAPPLQITTTSLPNGTVGSAYRATVTATGGVGRYTFSATGLPAGLTMSSGGVISGTTLTPSPFSEVQVQVHDAEVPAQTATTFLTLSMTAPLLQITTTSLPEGVVGTAYSATVTATGGVGRYTFSASGLPGGLLMSSSGAITGKPATAGTLFIEVQVHDAEIPAQTATAPLTFTIVSKLVITTTSLPLAGIGDNYVNVIRVTGGLAPVAFSVTNGTLPPGLTFVSGTIQGTPTTTGTYSFTVVATDGSSPRQTATQRLTIRVVPGVKIVTTSLPTATINTPYAANILVTGGTAPYTYQFISVITITGPTTIGSGNVSVLPPGMGETTNGSNGVLGIGGTPTGPAGTTTFIVTVLDANGLSYSQQLNLVVQ